MVQERYEHVGIHKGFSIVEDSVTGLVALFTPEGMQVSPWVRKSQLEGPEKSLDFFEPNTCSSRPRRSRFR